MTEHVVRTDRPSRRPGRKRAVLALGSVVGIGALLTTAAFSDTAEVAAGFTAGTLDIEVDGEQGNPVPYELVFQGADALVPGDTVFAPLVVDNVGSVGADLSLATGTTLTPALGNATEELRVSIVHTVGDACDATVVTADPSPYVSDLPLADAEFDAVSLPGGGSVDLCVAVSLPDTVVGTGGGSTEAVFTFLAEQSGV